MLFPLCLSQSNLSPIEALWDFCLEQAEGGSAAFGVLGHQVPGRCCQKEGVEVTDASLPLLLAGPGEPGHRALGFHCARGGRFLHGPRTHLTPAEHQRGTQSFPACLCHALRGWQLCFAFLVLQTLVLGAERPQPSHTAGIWFPSFKREQVSSPETKTVLQRPLGYSSQRFPGATQRGGGTDGSRLILV